ncbi:MAG: glycosyltransferase family 4 protein [Cytophagales bacterium]|nr:glycosyltransferase family 4 protein [Cytophagales bacterium]
MKIGIVINTSWNIYNFRMGLVKAFQAKGYQVVAIAPKDDYSSKLEEAGCEYYPIEMQNKGANPIKDFLLIRQFKKIYKEAKLDIVLQYTIKPNIYGTIAANQLKIPSVNNVSGLGTVFLHDNLVSKIAKALYRYAFRYPQRVFFQNNDDKQLFLDLDLVKEEKTGLLAGSGINTKTFLPQTYPTGTFTFLLVARLLYDKGIREYIEAIRFLKKEGINAQFLLCGFYDLASNLGVKPDEVSSWETEGIIHFLGKTDDIQETMKNVHCVVLPSYREGTPKTLIEASALRKVIVTTDVPGCREVVDHGINGYLCEVKNSVDLAEKMKQVTELSLDDYLQMADNSRKIAENKFDERFVIEKYLKEVEQNNNK